MDCNLFAMIFTLKEVLSTSNCASQFFLKPKNPSKPCQLFAREESDKLLGLILNYSSRKEKKLSHSIIISLIAVTVLRNFYKGMKERP